MKTFPKTVYVRIRMHDTLAVEESTDPITSGETIGVYELRAIKVVKKTVEMVDADESAPVPYEAR